jgi:hypothetical protein
MTVYRFRQNRGSKGSFPTGVNQLEVYLKTAGYLKSQRGVADVCTNWFVLLLVFLTSI